MKDQSFISDELLNAFVDDQLSTEEKEQVFAAIAQDAQLNQRVCELRSIHDLARLAYLELPSAPGQDRVAGGLAGKRVRNAGLAACLVLCLGLVIGWLINPEVRSIGSIMAAHHPTGHTLIQAANLQNKSKVTKVLFHLNSGSPAMAREALDEVENVLKYYAHEGRKARVELITNGGGINLLRKETSPYPGRIRKMQKEYPNLKFVTCQNSIDRLKRDHGVVAHLLPGTVVIDSGVAQIMRRQQEGWAYIEV